MRHPLLEWADARGWQVGWAPASVLPVALEEIGRRRLAGEVPERFAHDNLSFDQAQASRDPAVWRVLIVVMPRPAHRVGFVVGGARTEAIFPPTYYRYRPTFEDVRRELADGPLRGARVETLTAPLKLVAARLGLVRYGRTNVTYAPKIGSYLQLLGYLTDGDLPREAAREPGEPKLLEECEGCGVCEAVCPTGAIGGDRVLLHVERCLTMINEEPGEWPEWLPRRAHNALIGCLLCQRRCPANAELPVADSGVVFSEEETCTLLAEGERTAPAWAGIRAKLRQLGQEYQEDVIGRNLKALFARA